MPIALVHGAHIASSGREQRAKATWPVLNARIIPFASARSSAQIGDKRAMPFVRDMIHAAFSTGDECIAVICNNDIQMGAGLREAIIESCRKVECFWAHRVPEPNGKPDGGVDLVAMTRRWWHLHAHMLPDLLHGYRWWDQVLLRLMIWSGCKEGPRLYYHEPHANDHRSRLKTPGAEWNERLGQQWEIDYDDKDQHP